METNVSLKGFWEAVEYLDRGDKRFIINYVSKVWPSTLFNPLTLKISLVILLTISHTVLVMLVWRIWYWIIL